MMKQLQSFLFVTIEGGGNIPPMLGLARRLSARGHKVWVLTEPCLQQTVSTYGLQFLPFTQYFTRTDRKVDFFQDWKASPFSNPTMDRVIFGPADTTVAETLRALQEVSADVLVVDCLLTPALIAAESLLIPRVVVFHMPEYMPGPNRPPGMMGLLPGKGRLGRLRDRLLGHLFSRLLNKYLPLLNEVRKTHGLNKLHRVTDLLDQADLRLIQTLRSFDFPIEPSPSNVRYTGPVLDDPDWTASWESPWPADDTRPLVVVSLSSTFQNQRAVIQRCIDALRDFQVRALVTLGLALDHETLEAPDHVLVVRSAPHSKIFPTATLVITHAGHGTVMRALSHGLPLLCLPMGRDQNDNAAKVAYQGCGINLSQKASVPSIRQAIARMLKDQSFKQNALRLQKEICLEAEKDVAIAALEQLATKHRKAFVSSH